MIIEDGCSVVFTGDSITDAGRQRPVGEDCKEQLGHGYVAGIAAILEAWRPGHRIRIRNTGISGNTVVDLQARWQGDVLDLQPDWVSLMVGINDCSRAFSRPLLSEGLVPPPLFQATYDRLVGETRRRVRGMILMTPFYVEPNRAEPLRAALGKYADIVRELAQRHDCVLVDTQAAFDRALTRVHSCRLADDRVHPRQAGHVLLARAWLDAAGFTWN